MMASHSNETAYVILLRQYEEDKKHKEHILQEILTAVCAKLNSNGGKVVVRFETDNNVKDSFTEISELVRKLDQSMLSIVGIDQTISKLYFEEDGECITISVKKSDFLVTTNYNLYLPSQTQVVEESPLKPHKKIKDVINRKVALKPVLLGTHCQKFFKDKTCGFHESTTCQFKNLKAEASKRTTLGDRMTGKGNKFSCYVSAFANYNGGHIYYGITDGRFVEGEKIPNSGDENKIVNKVEKAIKKMIWPEIGQPKRGDQWEIFFQPVVDENSKPVPSTFVIVIYIAACLGGVFTEKPECYEMVEGEVKKMSFDTWKERISHSQPWLQREEQITWSSEATRKAFTVRGEPFRKRISNGNWESVRKECDSLQNESYVTHCKNLRKTMKLVILFREITAYNRRGKFQKAFQFLKEYKAVSVTVQDSFIFEVLRLYLEAALKRASEDFETLKELLTKALAMAEKIEPGLVTAIVYIFAATVSDLIHLEPSSVVLTVKALEHLKNVVDSAPEFVADMKRKANIILTTCDLSCNIRGKMLKPSIDKASLKEAKTHLKAIYKSAFEEYPQTVYFDIQLNLVLSLYKYRRSQLYPDKRMCDLRDAFCYAEKAESLANRYGFTEMAKWSKNNKTLSKEELDRARTPTQYHETDGIPCPCGRTTSQLRNAMAENSDDSNAEGDSADSQRNVISLDHFECVSSDDVADKKREENITSASYHLGFNVNGMEQQIHDSIDVSSLKEAKTHIKAIYKSGYKDHPPSVYCDIQLVLALSMFKYRHSQLYPDKSNSYFRDALSCIKKAQRLAGKYGFTKLIECSKKIEEELDRAKTPVQNHGNDDRPHSTSSPRHVTQNVESQDTSAKSQSSDDPNVEEKSQQTRAVDEEVPPAPSNVPTSNTEQEPEAENSGDKQAQLQSDRVSPSGPQKQSIDMSKFLSAKPFQPRTTSSSGSANQIPPNVSVTTKRPEIPMHDARGATALERNVSLGGQTGAPSFVGQVLYQGPPAMASFPVDVQVQHSPPLFLFAGYNYRSLVPNYPVDTSLPCQPWVGTQPDPAFSHFPLHPQPQHQQQVGDFQSSRFPAYDNTNEHRRQNTQCRQSRRDRS